MRIPVRPNSDSGLNRTAIPVSVEQPFRFQAEQRLWFEPISKIHSAGSDYMSDALLLMVCNVTVTALFVIVRYVIIAATENSE